MQGENEAYDELCCSICMDMFQAPITIECGHTFCRYCILNSLSSRNSCPMCRKDLTFVSDRPQQDEVLENIVQQIRRQENRAKINEKREERSIDYFQNIILIDIKSSDMLLPFTKIRATFQLQSQTLLGKLNKFVARQESPFHKYGVIVKLAHLNQLRYNIYECVVEGQMFCEISEEWVERKMDNEEQFFYRNCHAKFICENYDFSPSLFDPFFAQFTKITDKEILQQVYKTVDHEKLRCKTDPLALYYSIMKIIAMPPIAKYEVIVSFSQEQREQFLLNFYQKIKDQSKKNKLLIFQNDKSFATMTKVIIALAILFYFFRNQVGQY